MLFDVLVLVSDPVCFNLLRDLHPSKSFIVVRHKIQLKDAVVSRSVHFDTQCSLLQIRLAVSSVKRNSTMFALEHTVETWATQP